MQVKFKKNCQIYKIENETLEEIACKTGISVYVLQKTNPQINFTKGDYIEIAEQKFYVVKPLDTFVSIARRLGISEQMLKQKNNINQIFIGQVLFY